MRFIALLTFCIVLFSHAIAFSWTYQKNFNNGTPTAVAQGEDAFDGTAGRSYYTTVVSYEGGQAVELNILEGTEGYGSWGGMFDFPDLSHGDEFWFRIRIYFPADFDYTASPRLKFLRLHTAYSDNSNAGYNDIYINPLNSGNSGPFKGIKEFDNKWYDFGNWEEDRIVADSWETYEFYVKLDSQSLSDGGTGVMRLWKNGKLLGEHPNIRTLTSPQDYANFFYLFTYWNSDPYTKVYHSNEDSSGTFIDGEDVLVQSSGKIFRIRTVRSTTSLEIYSPSRGENRLDIVTGDILTGVTSGASTTVDTIKMQYPLKDQHLYIDDITLTNEQPSDQDEFGNYYLGYRKPFDLTKAIQPLLVVTGQNPPGVTQDDDTTGDGRIGLPEAISALRDGAAVDKY